MVEAHEYDIDTVALPLTLDNEVESILNNILNGEKIEVLSLNQGFDTDKNPHLIYPLMNIPRSWIGSWLGKLDDKYKYTINDRYAVDLMNFLRDRYQMFVKICLKSAL